MKYKGSGVEALVVLHRNSVGGTKKNRKVSVFWLRACPLIKGGAYCRGGYITSMTLTAFKTFFKLINNLEHVYVL